MNAREQEARAAKVEALVQAIDSNCLAVDLDIVRQGDGIADGLAQWEDSKWAEIALLAAVHPPSEETKAAVLKRYRDRAAAHRRLVEIGAC